MTILTAVIASCITIFAISVVTIFFAKCYRMGMGGVKSPFSDRRNLGLFVAGSVVALILCYQLVAQNHFIYYWDFGGYWTSSYTLMNDLFTHPYEAFKHIRHSVAHDDYNLFLPLLLALPLKLFGYTFLHYVMLVCAFFLLPTAFFLSSVCWKLLEPQERCPRVFFAILLLVFTFNALYGATLCGYADAGCLMPATLAVLLAVDCDLTVWNRQQKRRDVFIALLLVCSFLMRRYFAYFIVGYMVALVVCTLSITCAYHQGWKAALRSMAKNLGAIAGTALVTLLVFCAPMVKHVLTTNYAQQYQGYDLPFGDKIIGVSGYFGFFVIGMIIVALLAAALMKRWRRMTAFSFVTAIVTMLYFFMVQAMGIQHIYTLCVPVFLLLFLAYMQILRPFGKVRIVLSVVLGFFLAIGTLRSFQLLPQEFPGPVAAAYPAVTFHPMQRSDIAELHALADYLNDQADPEGKDIYLLASGSVLNSSVLDCLDKPYGTKPVHRLFGTNDVDLRDGFPKNFLKAEIVVVTDPVELHLAPGSQEVVRYLAECVQNPSSPIGRHFQKDAQEFILNKGRQVFVYHKVSEFTQEDLQALADYYTERYPGQEKIFSDRILSGGE